MSDVLNSWKQIAAYLGAGVRTVQRWERNRQLPVQHVGIGRRAPVLALKADIDAWVRARKGHLTERHTGELHDQVADVESLCYQARKIIAQSQTAREELVSTREAFRISRHALQESVCASRKIRDRVHHDAELRKASQAAPMQS